MKMLRLFVLLCVCVVGIMPVRAEKRVALVIGNGDYLSLNSLRNPVNDASDVAAALRRLGYSTTFLTNASQEQMETAVGDLAAALGGDSTSSGLFYYAGHGVQYQGSNYLIPTDADIHREAQLRYKALSLDFVLESLATANNAFNLILLDACRDNSFSTSRSLSCGLAVVGTQPPGSVVVYATSVGSVAADGSGRNGVFTAALLKEIEKPGVKLDDMLDAVAQDVQRQTDNRQTPAIYKQGHNAFYMRPSSEAVAAANLSARPETFKPAVLAQASQTGPFLLDFTFKADCFFRFIADEAEREDHFFQKGEQFTIDTAKKQVLLWLSNAGAVRMRVQRRDFELGKLGEVATRMIAWRNDAGTGRYVLEITPLY